MMDFTLAVVQCAPAFEGSLADNVTLIRRLLDQAQSQGADLVAFPEATLTGYLLDADHIRTRAVAVDSQPVQDVVDLTRETSACCAFGFYERDGGCDEN